MWSKLRTVMIECMIFRGYIEIELNAWIIALLIGCRKRIAEANAFKR